MLNPLMQRSLSFTKKKKVEPAKVKKSLTTRLTDSLLIVAEDDPDLSPDLAALGRPRGSLGDNMSTEIKVHPYTCDPTITWDLIKEKQVVKTVRPMKPGTALKDDNIRFVCISDTHGRRLDSLKIPDGDVLIVAGDFTSSGHPQEIRDFNEFLGRQPHRYKVVIAGNHELTFDNQLLKCNSMGMDRFFKSIDAEGAALRQSAIEGLQKEKIGDVRSLLTNCTYLEDSEVVINGLRIYGTPWQPSFDDWAFTLPRGQACLDKWNRIPAGVDVLITHTPPLGHGDLTRTGVRAGCVELLNSVRRRIRPKYHVFGHIHEGYGCTTDGYTKFINASTCDVNMKPVNRPIIFDLAVPRRDSD